MRELFMAVETEAETNPFLPAAYDILWSAVVFAVVMVFFVRFAIPRFRQILDDRAEAIEGNIAKADGRNLRSRSGSRADLR